MDIIEEMKIKGYKFDRCLTDEEIANIEQIYNIKFPKTLIEFYKKGLPIDFGFINWRDTSEENIENIKKILYYPINSLLYLIENDSYWVEDWPVFETIEERKQYFIETMKNEPIPIPIYKNRYILSSDKEENPAVLSFAGRDIIVYGSNLQDYLEKEFLGKTGPTYNESDYGKWAEIMDSYDYTL